MRLATWTYVDGLDAAVTFYQKVFDSKIKEDETWKKENGKYEICTLELEGRAAFSLAERKGKYAIEGKAVAGNTMQLCMLYPKKDLPKLKKTYELLAEGIDVRLPLQSDAWTTHTCDLIDKYGIRWCLMVWGE